MPSSSIRSVVLVEGTSDQRALEALAARLGRDLDADGVAVVPIGGAHAIGRYLEQYGSRGLGVGLAGLCDAGEEPHFLRALERAGLGSDLDRRGMESLGFFVCEANLEDELIRAVGAAGVVRVIDDEGDLGAFRTYRKQPAHRLKSDEEQLLGFMWNRKLRYAGLLVDALDLDQVPHPLAGVLGAA